MKRVRLLLLLALAGPGVVLLFGGGWLCYSSSGAGWLIEQAGAWGGVEVRVETVDGRLADRLNVQGLSIDLGDLQLTVDSAELDWSLWGLLGRELAVERLVVSGMDIVDLLPAGDAPSVGPPDPASFSPAGPWPLPEWLSGKVGLVQLRDFDYRDAEGPVAIADLIEARLEISDGLLVAETLNYISPYVHLEGAARWNLRSMDLDYRAAVSLPEDLVSAETLAVAALPVAVPGHLQVRGDWTAYRGTLELGDEETVLRAETLGTLGGVWFSDLSGRWLQGRLSEGRLDLDWSSDFRMDWQARAEKLNPEATLLGHPGELSFVTLGYLAVPDVDPLIIDGQLIDLQGEVDGRPLVGQGRIRWAGDELVFDQVAISAESLKLQAAGDLAERLEVDLQVAEIGDWLADAAGQLDVNGWLTWNGETPGGDLIGRGERLQWQEWQLAAADFKTSYAGLQGPLKVSIRAQELGFEGVRLSAVELDVNGLLEQHQINCLTQSDFGHVRLQASGGWGGGAWKGELHHLSTRLVEGPELSLQAPAAMLWGEDRWALSPLLLADEEGESLRIAGHYQADEADGDIAIAWSQLFLQRFGALFPEFTLEGQSSGELFLLLAGGLPEQLTVEAEAVGSFRHSAWSEALERFRLDLDWTDRQLVVSAAASAGTETSVQVDGEAKRPIGFDVPEQGHFRFQARNIRLSGLKPWLPPTLELDGHARLQGEGDWLGDGRFSLVAEGSSQGGHLLWQEPQGQLQADIDRVDLDLRWQEKELVAKADFVLGQQGAMTAEANLPLPARWPIVFDQKAPLSGQLKGSLVETGLVAALLPIPVEELTGRIQVDAQVAGSWQRPDLTGQFHLLDAGGYFPQLGISVEPLEANLQLNGDRLKIEKLRLVSGESEISGAGEIRLGGGTVQSYRLKLTGEAFQAADLPELSLLLSPDLQIEGDVRGLQVRGKVEVPLLSLRGVQGAGAVRASPDVVVIQPEAEPEPVDEFKSNVDVEVILGEEVRLSAAGLNARLTGAARVRLDEQARLLATGEIRVAEGDYAAYGAKLSVRQGVIRYQNAPVDNPSLNILALREVGRVKAGVQIGGTAERPVVTLYSKPAMPEKDILFTILTGRPVTPGDEESSALMLGAGALMAPGESVLAELGLTDVDIQGLFAGDGGIRLRRRLGESWEVESILGINSGVDLFYVIEFD